MGERILMKQLVDFTMVAALLFLMTYALIGERAHELLGCAMFVLMIAHMALNFSWYRALGRGRYPPYRIAQTVIDFLILGGMFASLLSGIRLSKHVFESLGLTYNISAARIVHLLASHWGFCLMSLHLGMHRRTPRRRPWILFGAAGLLAAYGLYAFISRGLWRYMLLLTRFAFYDYEEPLPLFLADYLSIMALFVLLGFLLSRSTRGTFPFRRMHR